MVLYDLCHFSAYSKSFWKLNYITRHFKLTCISMSYYVFLSLWFGVMNLVSQVVQNVICTTLKFLNRVTFDCRWQYLFLHISKYFTTHKRMLMIFYLHYKSYLSAFVISWIGVLGWNPKRTYKELFMMSDYNWFEGIPFPAISYQREILEDIRNKFVVKEEDLLILTYPKSGKNRQ